MDYTGLFQFFNSEQWRVIQIKELLRKHSEIVRKMERTMTPEQVWKAQRECKQEVVKQYSVEMKKWSEKKKEKEDYFGFLKSLVYPKTIKLNEKT